MGKANNKWQQRGFNDKYEYAGWLHFNDLTDDSKMHDDVYYDEYSGKIVDINYSAPTEGNEETDEADTFLKDYE